MKTRSISTIAFEIAEDWKKVSYGAKPYLEAMFCLSTITDKYMMDNAASIILYFLCNASSWKGDKAKAIKGELRAILKTA